jgi:hypothetical protein
MKRKLSLLSVILLYVICIQARSFVLDGVNYAITSTVSPYSVSVISGVSYTGDLVIPSAVSHNDTVFSVTSIYMGAFYGSSSLTSVSIPNSVSSIGMEAFLGCSGLKSINIDPTNQYFNFIDSILYASGKSQILFCVTGKKDRVDIPETVTIIGEGAFYGCSGITSVIIPNSVKTIGTQAFYNCTGLNSVTIGDSTNTGLQPSISCEFYAFYGCSALSTLSLYKPIDLYSDSFQDLPSLKTLVIGNSVTTIDYSIFSRLTGLTKVILGRADLSPATITVYSGAFNGSLNLESLDLNCNLQLLYYRNDDPSPFSTISTLTIGDKVTSIGDNAFNGSKNLKSINVPNAVKSIGISSFAGCTKVTGITLGSSVAKLGTGVFTGCNSLLSINTHAANTNFSSINGVLFSKDQQLLIQYPTGRSGDYEIPTPVKTVGANAFLSTTGLQSVLIPQAITSIQSSAFANCNALTSITIGHPDSISTATVRIATDAFTGCPSITQLALNKTFSFTSGDNSPFKNLTLVTALLMGNGVASIPDYSFSGCTGLNSVRFGQTNSTGKNAITVSAYAFSGCTNFKTLELNKSITIDGYQSPFTTISNLSVGNGVSFIGNQTFDQCSKLSSAILPVTVTKIGNEAFQNCSKLQSVSFPGINTIGDGAFYNCIGLTSIVLPNSLKIIQPSVFYGCSALSSLTLNDSITQIQDNAFYGCRKLTGIVIPNSTKSLGTSAFEGCTGFTSVILGTSLQSIGSSAFGGCSAITAINFPASVRTVGASAFQNCSGLLSLYLPGTVTSVGASAFANCKGIVDLTIGEADNPGLPSTFGTYPFDGCSGITSLLLNKNINDDTSSSPFMSLSSLRNVSLSNRVTHLNTFAFYGCSKIKTLTIPNSVASIGDAAFQGCSSLTDIKLPANTNYLPNQIFYGCTNLKSLYIPSKVITIGSYAFYECTNLTTLTIPKSVIAIGPLALSGCTALNELISATPVPAPLGISCLDAINTTTCKLYVPMGSKPVYQTADQWKNFESIIEKDIKDSIQTPDTITCGIKTVTISAGGLSAALTATELASVSNLTVLGSMNSADLTTINGMHALNILDLGQVTIQSNTVPSYAFTGNSSLVFVTLPSTATSLGTRAFENCSRLIMVTLPIHITSIESSTFATCSSLMVINIPSSVTIIKASAFYSCGRLFVIKIPTSVKTIEDDVFANCNGFSTINLPNSITSIGEYAFAGCYSLQTITIPSLVKIISDGMFRDCYSLNSIFLPSSMTTIASGEVFSSCHNLSSIYVNQSVPVVLTQPIIFYSVNTSTCVLYVPAGSLKAYQQASQWGDFVNIREMTNTAVSTQNIDIISFYPNPVKDGFQINGLTDTGILTLTNLNGNILLTKQVTGNEYVTLSSFPAGLYIAKIVTKNFSIEKKIIKK